CPVPAPTASTKNERPTTAYPVRVTTMPIATRAMKASAERQNPLRGARLNNRKISSSAKPQSGGAGGIANSAIGMGAQCIVAPGDVQLFAERLGDQPQAAWAELSLRPKRCAAIQRWTGQWIIESLHSSHCRINRLSRTP